MITPLERIVGLWAAVTGVSLTFAFVSIYRRRRYLYVLFLGLAALVWSVNLLGGGRVSTPAWITWTLFALGLFLMFRDSVRRYRETYQRITEEKRRRR